MRYFVLSYVTRPTTINAMTDIPANTPRPIGRTSSFRPGTCAAAGDSCAAAALGVLSSVLSSNVPKEVIAPVRANVGATAPNGAAVSVAAICEVP